jgi:hypothetical protein
MPWDVRGLDRVGWWWVEHGWGEHMRGKNDMGGPPHPTWQPKPDMFWRRQVSSITCPRMETCAGLPQNPCNIYNLLLKYCQGVINLLYIWILLALLVSERLENKQNSFGTTFWGIFTGCYSKLYIWVHFLGTSWNMFQLYNCWWFDFIPLGA